MYTRMYFFIFIGGVNTRTSMIKTNVFFDVIDFQVPPLPNLTKVPAVMPSDPAQMAALFERVDLTRVDGALMLHALLHPKDGT